MDVVAAHHVTLEALIADAGRQLDALLEHWNDLLTLTMIEQGLEPDDVEAILALQHANALVWRAEVLDLLRSSLIAHSTRAAAAH